MRKGNLIVISGPSGAGKDTICRKLLGDMTAIDLSISMTTREPRANEVDGISYYFTTVEEFEKRISQGDLLEYAKVFDNYYGTPKSRVVEMLKMGNDVLLEIDTQGALAIKEAFEEAILIFIMPPSMEELERRLRERGTENEEVLIKRLGEANREMEMAGAYNYTVINDNLDIAVENVKKYILSHRVL